MEVRVLKTVVGSPLVDSGLTVSPIEDGQNLDGVVEPGERASSSSDTTTPTIKFYRMSDLDLSREDEIAAIINNTVPVICSDQQAEQFEQVINKLTAASDEFEDKIINFNN